MTTPFGSIGIILLSLGSLLLIIQYFQIYLSVVSSRFYMIRFKSILQSNKKVFKISSMKLRIAHIDQILKINNQFSLHTINKFPSIMLLNEKKEAEENLEDIINHDNIDKYHSKNIIRIFGLSSILTETMSRSNLNTLRVSNLVNDEIINFQFNMFRLNSTLSRFLSSEQVCQSSNVDQLLDNLLKISLPIQTWRSSIPIELTIFQVLDKLFHGVSVDDLQMNTLLNIQNKKQLNHIIEFENVLSKIDDMKSVSSFLMQNNLKPISWDIKRLFDEISKMNVEYYL